LRSDLLFTFERPSDIIAAKLVTPVRKSVTIDWTLCESARAKIKVLVKRILRKHGYPPDLEEEATKTVSGAPLRRPGYG
jgi:hypothetical protein